jgi:hypothetical protein
MRKLIFMASVLLSTAAGAQPPRPAAAPPVPFEQAGQRIERLADALMDVDIGPVLAALSPDGRPRGPATLGELANRRDPRARERMHEDIAATSAGLGAAARDAAILAPVVRHAFAEAARQIETAAAEARAQSRRPAPYPGEGQAR